MNRYWISFAGQNKNLGVALVEADSHGGAVNKTHDLGINPGGQAMVCVFDPPGKNKIHDEEWERWPKNELIDSERFREAGYQSIGESNQMEKALTDQRIEFVCPACNETDCRCN